jgi:hypothetical protein
MIMHDEYSKNLVHDFLWGDINNVYSSKEYPQFNMSQNNGEILYARFDNTSSGYHSTNDTALVLKNMSVEADVVIWSINAIGADIDFDYEPGLVVEMGQVMNINAINNDFENAEIPFEVQIVYSLLNNQLTSTTKAFCFTPMTDAQMAQYSYLSQVADVVPDEEIIESTTTPEDDITESTTESTSDDTTVENEDSKTENVEGDIPKTNRSISTVLVAVAVLAGTAVTAGIVIKKREE